MLKFTHIQPIYKEVERKKRSRNNFQRKQKTREWKRCETKENFKAHSEIQWFEETGPHATIAVAVILLLV